MNLAPYLFAFANEWTLPPQIAPDNLRRAVNENQDFIKKIIETQSFLFKPIDFPEIQIENPIQAGMYFVRQNEWVTLLNDLTPPADDNATYSGEFVSGIEFPERGVVLMFPDDTSPNLNLSFFAPTVNSQRELVLNSIKLWLDFELKDIRNIFSSKNGGCSLSVDGNYPRRKFKCSQTGCQYNCTTAKLFNGQMPIITCECSQE